VDSDGRQERSAAAFELAARALVVARAAIDVVAPVAATQQIVAGFAEYVVIVVAAADLVVASACAYPVVSRSAFDVVVPLSEEMTSLPASP